MNICFRNALYEMNMNSDRRLLRERKDVGNPGKSIATDRIITPLSNVSEEDITFGEWTV